MTPTSQAEIVTLANSYADESKAKAKKMTGWAIGLGIAMVALVVLPVAPLAGAFAGAGALLTGSLAFGHHNAEKLMREAASEAGQDGFSEKLKARSEKLAATSKKAVKWGTIGMVGFAGAIVGSLLFPAAAPVLGMVRSLGTMIWGYNSIKSFANDASNTHASNLYEKVRELEQRDATPLPEFPANDDASLGKSPAPGLAFTLAVKPEARDDAPVLKTGTQPDIRL